MQKKRVLTSIYNYFFELKKNNNYLTYTQYLKSIFVVLLHHNLKQKYYEFWNL